MTLLLAPLFLLLRSRRVGSQDYDLDCWKREVPDIPLVHWTDDYIRICKKQTVGGVEKCQAGSDTGCATVDKFVDCLCATQTIRRFCHHYKDVESNSCSDLEKVEPCLSVLTDEDDAAMANPRGKCKAENLDKPTMPCTGCNMPGVVEMAEKKIFGQVKGVLEGNGCDLSDVGESDGLDGIYDIWFRGRIYPKLRPGYAALVQKCADCAGSDCDGDGDGAGAGDGDADGDEDFDGDGNVSELDNPTTKKHNNGAAHVSKTAYVALMTANLILIFITV